MRPTVALLLAVSLTSTLAECPAKCSCSKLLHHVTCTHSHLTTLPIMTSSYRIAVLQLQHNEFAVLENGSFRNSNFDNVALINLSHNNISVVESDTFLGLAENLISLAFRHNPYLQLPEYGFHLENLIDLDMSSCNLKKITKHFFDGTPNLVYLYLSENKLAHFDPKIVAPYKGLELDILTLSNNNIRKLDFRLIVFQLNFQQKLLIDNNPFHCDCDFLFAFSLLDNSARPAKRGIACHTPAYLEGVTGDQLMKMHIQCDPDGSGELVRYVDGSSWWYLHQWWILSLGAIIFVSLAAGRYIFRPKCGSWFERKECFVAFSVSDRPDELVGTDEQP